jgi:hypothetical protein
MLFFELFVYHNKFNEGKFWFRFHYTLVENCEKTNKKRRNETESSQLVIFHAAAQQH